MSAAEQRATAFALLELADKQDYDTVYTHLSDSPAFKWHFRPTTVGGFGKPDGFSKADLKELWSKPSPIKKFGFGEPKDITQGEDAVVMHFLSNGETHDGEPYTCEYVVWLFFEPGTTRIIKILDFTDSAYFLGWLEKQQAKAAAAAN